MDLIDRIREATTEVHRSAERAFLGNYDLTSRSSYLSLLQCLHAWIGPWESAVRDNANEPLRQLMSTRWREPLLRADLQDLGSSPREPEPVPQLPQMKGSAILGSVYVMEGSTLGGLRISSILEQHLGLTTKRGRSYFFGSGALTMPRWRQFLDELRTLSVGSPEKDVVRGAQDTFECLTNWFNEWARHSTTLATPMSKAE